MKKILKVTTIFYLLVSFQINKETYGKFEYEQIETRNKGFKSHITFYNLNLNKNFTTYTQIFNEELDEKYTENTDEGINDVIVIKPKKNEMKIVYNDFVKNQSFFKDIVAFDIIYTKEEVVNMEWQLFDEKKNFGKRKCKKATTVFRGRTYTAWYSPEIKTKIGPWKFKNTPGLIFEIYDEDKILHIKLNTLNTKKQSNINSWENEKIKKIISLNEYKKLKDKEEDLVLERLNSKLPKGSKPFIRNTEQIEIEIF